MLRWNAGPARAFAVALLVLGVVASAQGQGAPSDRPQPGAGSGDADRARRIVEAFRMARLTQDLDLDVPTAARLFPVLHRHDEAAAGLARKRAELIRKLDERGREKADDKELKELLDALVVVAKEACAAETKLLEAVREVLSPRQTARYVVLGERLPLEARALPSAPDGAGGRPNEGQRATDAPREDGAEPREAHALFQRAMKRLAKQDGQGAIADLTKAIELDPRRDLYWGARGQAKLLDGDPAGAIADATKAIELGTEIAQTWFVRGSALAKKGEVKRACDDLRRFLELAPRDSSFVREARALIADLEKR